MIVISFCSIEFVKKNFHFLKTTMGRGLFDIFCAGLFLVTADSIMGWVMMAILLVCGVFFVVMGCLNKEVGGEDYDPNNLKKDAMSAAIDNRSLME
jgi:hypothetical protein